MLRLSFTFPPSSAVKAAMSAPLSPPTFSTSGIFNCCDKPNGSLGLRVEEIQAIDFRQTRSSSSFEIVNSCLNLTTKRNC